MPSTRSKGHKQEKKYKDILESLGYQCSPAPKKVMWIPSGKRRIPVVSDADYYGIIDIISFNQHHWRVSQVTHWESFSQYPRMNKIIEFVNISPFPENTIIEVVAWRGGRKMIDKRYTKEKRYVPHQLFYVYSLVFNEFKETMRISKSGEVLWQLKDYYESYNGVIE